MHAKVARSRCVVALKPQARPARLTARWYACEFFVSQTPELTGMADRIIDLEGMATEAAGEVA